ncbi:hypothetical protein BXY47_2712 [Dietzia kunjamensis]|uniref:hypothetical protein n=1 Tax=Dietzia kunjamensis TaxID=322509 RepID=UPI000FF6A6E4|nr:hypothetical protein [Dietzia kunjamensis]MBB1012799.1 hypothetical protein [Dietzia kunjamensis]RKE59625.1 hypothetical protein BXY47_2712 [Dietzia kunjamensis]
MGSEAFGDDGSLGGILGEGGTFDVVSSMLGWVNNLVKGIGYFAGGDLQEAWNNGFIAG